jgi:WD40 repeat protein
MDGCRVVAGTTCGDLRVWSIKDVYSAVFYSARGGDLDSFSPELPTQRHAAGTKSTFLTERRKKATDFAAGSSLTRLKFSLRGRALSGHRGGVSCISLHSNLYKPDSVVTGGADGLIKLWSLRTPGSSGSRRASFDTTATSLLSSPPREKFGVSGKSGSGSSSRTGDALSILTGHGGRVLCVNTAWHGDRLLSGGADRTVRLWDLASGNGKCLHSLSGHFGWVTAVKFWGPNTLISASTDRSIALWDARVSSAPLFVLRHHNAPISDMLISPRSSDPVMISAAVDGSVASWDFRELSGRTTSVSALSPTSGKSRPCQVVRSPASMAPSLSKRQLLLGPVLLSKGVLENKRTILYTGADSVLREWDYQRGQVVSEHATGHCDSISNLLSFRNGKVLDNQLENTTGGGGGSGSGSDYTGGSSLSTITASNDGTIRLRTMMQK